MLHNKHEISYTNIISELFVQHSDNAVHFSSLSHIHRCKAGQQLDATGNIFEYETSTVSWSPCPSLHPRRGDGTWRPLDVQTYIRTL